MSIGYDDGAVASWTVWVSPNLADAAGCGRSSAASFLQRQRPSTVEDAR